MPPGLKMASAKSRRFPPAADANAAPAGWNAPHPSPPSASSTIIGMKPSAMPNVQMPTPVQATPSPTRYAPRVRSHTQPNSGCARLAVSDAKTGIVPIQNSDKSSRSLTNGRSGAIIPM